MTKYTDWFPPEIKPVHVGVYELEDLPYPFHYWDGARWFGAGARGEKIRLYAEQVDYGCRVRWRGLSEKPKGE